MDEGHDLPIMRSCYTHFCKNASSRPTGTEGSFPRDKTAGAWSCPIISILHLVLRSNNDCSYTSTPLYAFMDWYLVKHGDNLIFTFNLMDK
jgi:hypothetical protein